MNLKIDFRRLSTLIGKRRQERKNENGDIVANYRAYSRGSAGNWRNLSNRRSVVEKNDARKMASFGREGKGGVGQRARVP